MSLNKIELLAPAGSLEQGLNSIASGSDALYGGLREWNARSRAKNLSEDDYRILLNVCREQHIKFYLTLNTLIKETESKKILKQLSRIKLPDAIIATDIGFIQSLRREYPNLDVHASTQFGAYTAEDLNFLEWLGVKRAILARELSLNEISQLKRQSKLELEVFVYGSQCISFSGQCLWSGLMHECSGNRGRCAAPCRNLYSQDDKQGQYLYPRDLNATAVVKALEKIGVAAIKLEGRYRNAKQTGEAVKKFRRAIDESEWQDDYNGYLGNKIPVKGMLNKKNPRKGNLKSSFTEPQNLSNDSASIFCTITDKILNQIEITDNLGNIKRYDIVPENFIELSAENFSRNLKERLNFKLHEITLNVAQDSQIFVNAGQLNQIVEDLNGSLKIIPRPKAIRIRPPQMEDYLQINNFDLLKNLTAQGYRNFIFEVTDLDGVRKALELDCNIIYRLPVIDFNQTSEKIFAYLNGQRVMITRPSQIFLIDNYKFAEVIGAETLNIWNNETLNIFKNFGVTKFVASPELAIEESEQLSRQCGVPLMKIIFGRIPLGYTRACFGEVGLCDGRCGQTTFELKNSQRGYRLIIECKNLDHRIILSKVFQASSTELRGQCCYLLSHLNFEEFQKLLKGELQEIPAIGIYGRSVQ